MSTRIRIGQGRVEFIAHREEILKRIEQGYSIIRIHEELTEQGKLTMAYPSFCAIVRRYNRQQQERQRMPMENQEKSQPKNTDTKLIGQQPSTFGKGKKKSFEDMFGNEEE